MKKGRVVNLNKIGNMIGIMSKNNIIIILTLIFIIGLAIGIFSFGKYDFVINIVSNYLSKFIYLRTDSSFFRILADSLFESMIFIILSFCIGTSMFGSVAVIPIVSFKAFSYGSLVAFLYSQYNIKGIAFNAVLILPFSIFFIIALFLSCSEAIKFSFLLANQTFDNSEYKSISLCFKNYCIRHLFILLIVLFSAIADALISSNFINNLRLT